MRVATWNVNSVGARLPRLNEWLEIAEPDVLLMIEYPNMGAFDRPLAEDEATMSKVFGSVVKSNQAFAARDTLRTNRGQVLAREMKFTK